MHLPCHSPAPYKSGLLTPAGLQSFIPTEDLAQYIKRYFGTRLVYLWARSLLSIYELCSIRDHSLTSSAQCCGFSVCTGWTFQALQAMMHTWQLAQTRSPSWISPTFLSMCLLAWFLPANSCSADLELRGLDSWYKSVLRKERVGDTGEQVVCKQPGPPAAVLYKGHRFENSKKNPVPLRCALLVFSPWRLMLCWERTYTTDKSIPLANFIMPQVLPLQRVSPSCHGSDIHAGSQDSLSMQQKQGYSEIRTGPQGEHPAVARPMARPFPSVRATMVLGSTGCCTQHLFQPPFPGCGTASTVPSFRGTAT